ncbi:helix-turn-helix domain-containing protein [Paenibacillus sp. JX-17]|uniref:Helix-turn-helix domain-containing protein n=1 Tax=Paenibacillus lacisoli TaxID=3064525 RepID=A0ABT9CBL7_9BACL|nr:TrmB family transcriptional regulator [Paenibacillus sp. JX-17]MDO7906659.1 helix-turn-helix domain-containing protein [Paenibacillus sp. JX-17]
MEHLLQHLRNLGFTEMEGKVMVELAKQGSASGYEVAKRLGVSRSNVYGTLQRLAQQGYLQAGPGEPVRYSVLDTEELTKMISSHLQQSLEAVKAGMPKHQPERPLFFNVEGDKNVLESLARELSQAEHEIIVDIYREEAALLREELEEAEARGVRVLWSCDGADNTPARWMSPSVLGNAGRQGGRRFSFVIDRRRCMLGMRGEPGSAQAVVTEHPVMAELLLSHFAQELVLFELDQDMGAELEGRYGPLYQSIIRRYAGGPS